MALQQALTEIDSSSIGKLGCCVLDLATGTQAGIRQDELFPMASIFKIGVMIECYRLAADGQLDLGELVAVDQHDDSIPPNPDGPLFRKPRHSWHELIHHMITTSDNYSTDIILRRVGRQQVNATMSQLGFPHTHVGWDCKRVHYQLVCMGSAPTTPENDRRAEERRAGFVYDRDDVTLKAVPGNTVTTPAEMAALLACLCRGDIVSPAASAAMLDVMKQQRQRSRIPRFLPEEAVVANKTGAFFHIRSDAGVVWLAERTLVVTGFLMDVGLIDDSDIAIAKVAAAACTWLGAE